MRIMCRVWVLLGVFFFSCIPSRPVYAQHAVRSVETVKIGVLSYRGDQDALDRWTPTAEYLSEKIPGYSFKIVPLGFSEISPAVAQGKIDFVLANPSMYVELETLYRVRRLATLKRAGPGKISVTEFGGVIFTRADRTDIKSLEDLRGKSFMAVDESSLGGWRVCWRHMKKRGIDPYRDLSKLAFGETHDKVVFAVRDGLVDAGTVRTDILEHMEADGKINMREFRIIDLQKHEGFPFAVSTALYPEWPFAEVRHAPAFLAEQVAVALLNMHEDDLAAKKAGIAGWTVPFDYQPVHDALKELRVGVYKNWGRATPREVIWQYRWQIAFSMAMLFLLSVATFYLIRMNRKLGKSRSEIEEARNNLKTRIEERTAELVEVNNKILLEIEERRSTETLLYQAKQDWEDTFNTITDAITIHDKDFNIILYNKPASELLDLPSLNSEKAKCYKCFHGKERAPEDCPSCRSLITGKPYVSEVYEPHLNMFVEIRAMPRLDAAGNVIGLIHVVRNITEHKKTEEEIRRNYDTLVVISSLLHISLDNASIDYILGQALDHLLSIQWLSLDSRGAIFLIEDDPGKLVMKVQKELGDFVSRECAVVPFGKCHCGRAAEKQEIEFASALDERHDVFCEGMGQHGHYCIPIVLSGKTLGVINLYLREGHREDEREKEFLRAIAATLAGIIQRKRAEEEKEKIRAQLYQAQKMESVGRLAGGIAHDFNNMLTVILGFGDLMAMEMEDNSRSSAYLDQIVLAANKAAKLAQGLLAFSRQQVMNPKPLNLNEVILTMQKILARVINESIELRTMLTDKDLVVMADAGQIEQVLMNLTTNAKDAMPEGGRLTIESSISEMDESYAVLHGYGTPGRYAVVSFSDTGKGMDAETKGRIFEPFFTTKEPGKGTGLGLAIIYGIIKQHGGYINVYSEVNKGTTFKIYLPIVELQNRESHDPTLPAPKGGTETILVIEDEQPVRQFTRMLLEKSDYTVIEAADGDDGLDKFKENNEKIQLLVLDVIMPKRNGKEVFKEIKKIKHAIKTLFISGYTGNTIDELGLISGETDFLTKPFSPGELLRKIRLLLDSTPH